MDAVTAAFEAWPRDGFLPRPVRRRASYDGPLEIGGGQTNSQPRTVAAMLRLLDVRPGQRVLDVGAGSGWTTALLAHLDRADRRGRSAWSWSRSWSRSAAATSPRPGSPGRSIRAADPGVLGLPDEAPWDRILVSAEPRSLPDALVDQLADDGVMVIPVAGTMLRVTNPGAVVTDHGRYRFVPLR